MANIRNYNYQILDRPYNTFMERSSESGAFDQAAESLIGNPQEGIGGFMQADAPTIIDSAEQILPSALNGSSLTDTWIETWIKSRNYLPKTAGFYIDGRTGYIECRDFFSNNATIEGTIIAGAGSIGGFILQPTYIRDAADSFGLSSVVTGGDDVRFWAGETFANRATAPFRVTESGVIAASSGVVGGWTLGTTKLSSSTIELDAGNTRIRSTNYASGVFGSGFTLESDLLEVGNIAARGLIRTAVFQKDVVSSVGGNLAVLDADVLDEDMIDLDSSSMTTKGTTTFNNGDILRIKDGVDDEWFTVVDNAVAPFYIVTRDEAGSYAPDLNPTWKKGATIVNYGQTGDGGIFMTASETEAPYLSVFTHTGTPWTTITQRVRLGKLDGISDPVFGALSGYGLWTDNIYLTGGINASVGLIGGFTIGSTYIRDVAGVVGMSSAVTGGDDIRFWAGNVVMASAPFYVTEAGALVASSATITGVVTANTGFIGGSTGWVIAANTIKDVAGLVGLSNVVTGGDDIRIWAGHVTPSSAPFYVTEAGALVATSATIAGAITANTGYIGGVSGWVIAANTIKDVAGLVGLSNVVTGGDDIRFWAGHVTPASAPFYVTEAGALVASSATISGTITATTGAIGGWVVTATALKDAAGLVGMSSAVTAGDDYRFWAGDVTPASAPFSVTEAGVIKASSGTIGGNTLGTTFISSTTFVSGPLGSGWRVMNTGVAEFQDVTVRGIIRTSVFEKDTISAINGIVLISKADALNVSMTALDASTVTITGETTFVANEVIRIKDGTNDEWMLVTNAASAPIYTVTRDLAGSYAPNTNPIWTKGTAVVSMGVGTGTKTGFILLDSSSASSPYIDVYNRNSNTYTDTSLKARLGWLQGIVDADVGLNSTDVWGLYSDSVYLKGAIVANTGYIGGTTGWVITTNNIKDVAGLVGLSNTVTGGDDIRFWAGHVTPSSALFRVYESGAIVATSATITGAITATSGAIGGWVVDTTSIKDAAGVVGMSSAVTAGDDIRFWAGDVTPGSAEFRVTEAGALTASSATITGVITANTGFIGGATGWVIATGKITSTGIGVATTAGDATYAFWAGDDTPASAEFRVSHAGALVATSATITGAITASSGSIGSFTIGTYLYTGTKTAYNDVNAGVHLGSDGIGIGNNVFTVSSAGALTATSATITGAITATSGAIGGWVVTATDIKDAAGLVGMSSTVTGGDDIRFFAGNVTPASAPFKVTEAGVITASSGTVGGNALGTTFISSTTFVSGPLGSGWRVMNTGVAEFQDVTIRGTIRTSVFEKDTISAINGIVLISKADVLASAMTALDASTITISGETAFVANEVIRIKDGTNDEYMLVTSAASAPTYTVTRDLAGTYAPNTNPIWTKGTAVASMGVGTGTKTGFILLDSSSASSPYIDIYKRNSNTYTDTTLQVRLGWLQGITDADVGLAATDVWGLYSQSVYLKGTIVANAGYIGGTTGWVITTNNIKDVAGLVGLSNAVTAGDDIRFWAGHVTPASAPFYVTESGALVATSATISGAITATSGAFGGWTVNATSIFTGTEDHAAYTANSGDLTLYSNGSDASIHGFNFYIDTTGVFNGKSTVLDGPSTIGGRTGTALASAIDASANLVTDLINARLDTSTKKMLSNFTFGTADYAGALNTGTITWNTTTGALTGGSGVLVFRGGIIGAAAGVATFTIDSATGAATFAGALSAPTGTIGGFTISATTLSVTSGANTTTISSGATAFSAGPTATPSITITQAGVLTASGVSVTGTINATSGYFGNGTNGLTVASTGLTIVGSGFVRTAASGSRIELSSYDGSVGTSAIKSYLANYANPAVIDTVLQISGVIAVVSREDADLVQPIQEGPSISVAGKGQGDHFSATITAGSMHRQKPYSDSAYEASAGYGWQNDSDLGGSGVRLITSTTAWTGDFIRAASAASKNSNLLSFESGFSAVLPTRITTEGYIDFPAYRHRSEFDEVGAALASTVFAKAFWVGAGTNGTQDIVNGYLSSPTTDTSMILSTTGTASSTSTLTFSSLLQLSNQGMSEMFVRIVQSSGAAITNCKAEWGWRADSTHYMVFRFDTAVHASNIYIATKNGATAEVVTATSSSMTTSFRKYRIRSYGGTTHFAYIDTADILSLGSGSLPSTAKPYFYIDNKAVAQENIMLIDYVEFWTGRSTS